MAEKAEKIDRKYLAHLIDASFGATNPKYVRLGKDLEEYKIELNPDITSKKNILGETSVTHNGYEPKSEVDTFYAYKGDPLYEKLESIANDRSSGSECETTIVDVLLDSDATVVWAYRESVIIGVNSIGGDTSGVQIPFSINYNGNREKGTFDMETKAFTKT